MSVEWSEYFTAFAALAATKSKDETQVGAILVGPEREIRLTGFNGPPIGVKDTPERRERPTKYFYTSHAEMNLIAFAARHGIRTEGCTVYVTHMCCSICTRLLIQAGIKKVEFAQDYVRMPTDERLAVINMMTEAGIDFDIAVGANPSDFGQVLNAR